MLAEATGSKRTAGKKMPERKRIGLREVRALKAGEQIWDASVTGFHARKQKDSVTYLLFYRTGGRQRWYTIGRHGAPWTPNEAREEARRVLGEVAKGNDPAANRKASRKAVTVQELCDRYWQDVTTGRWLTRGGRPKKKSTLESDIGRIE